MLQWYIRALADHICDRKIYREYFGVIAGNYISSNDVKKYQQAFLALLPVKIFD